MAKADVIRETLKIETMLARAQDIEKQVKQALRDSVKPLASAQRKAAPVEDPNLVRPADRHLKNSISVITEVDGHDVKVIVKPNYKRGYGGRSSHLTEWGYQHASGATIPGKAWWAPAVDQNEDEVKRLKDQKIAELLRALAK
jgi:hypothetical protein